MEALRFVLYGGAFLASVAVAAQFVRVRHTLARMLVVTWAVWAANAVVLAFVLAETLAAGTLPERGAWPLTVNAFLLFAAPALMLLWFSRWQSDGGGG